MTMATTVIQCDYSDMAPAFNEWLRRYTENPEQFEAQFRTIERAKAELAEGKEPSYGEVCVEYLGQIAVELKAKAHKAERDAASSDA
jgi:hypothetical protein